MLPILSNAYSTGIAIRINRINVIISIIMGYQYLLIILFLLFYLNNYIEYPYFYNKFFFIEKIKDLLKLINNWNSSINQ